MLELLSRCFNRSHRKSRRPARPLSRLGFESLEGRTVLSSAGGLDFSFGTGGTVLTNFNFFSDTRDNGAAIALQDDGKVVVVGSTNHGGNLNLALARYR